MGRDSCPGAVARARPACFSLISRAPGCLSLSRVVGVPRTVHLEPILRYRYRIDSADTAERISPSELVLSPLSLASIVTLSGSHVFPGEIVAMSGLGSALASHDGGCPWGEHKRHACSCQHLPLAGHSIRAPAHRSGNRSATRWRASGWAARRATPSALGPQPRSPYPHAARGVVGSDHSSRRALGRLQKKRTRSLCSAKRRTLQRISVAGARPRGVAGRDLGVAGRGLRRRRREGLGVAGRDLGVAGRALRRRRPMARRRRARARRRRARAAVVGVAPLRRRRVAGARPTARVAGATPKPSRIVAARTL